MNEAISKFMEYFEITKTRVRPYSIIISKLQNSLSKDQNIYDEVILRFVKPVLSPLFDGYGKDSTSITAGCYLLAGGIAGWEKFKYIYTVDNCECMRSFPAPDYTRIPVQGMAIVASLSAIPTELSEFADIIEMPIAAFINVKTRGEMQEIHLDLMVVATTNKDKSCYGIVPYVVNVPIGGLVTKGKLKTVISEDHFRFADATKSLAMMLLYQAGTLVKSEEFEDEVLYDGDYTHHPTPDFSDVVPSDGIHIITRRAATMDNDGQQGNQTGHHKSPTPHIRTGYWRRVRVGPRNKWHYETRWIKETTVAFRGEVPFATAVENKEE